MAQRGVQFAATYTAVDRVTGAYVVSDVANHTVKYALDGVLTTPANAPYELSFGEYGILLTASEMQAASVTVYGASSTNDVILIKTSFSTEPLAVFLSGTAQAGSPTTITLANTTPVVSLVNQQIQLTGGSGFGQVRTIGIYNPSTFVATPTLAWDSGQAPDATTTYTLIGLNSANIVNVQVTDPQVIVTP